MCAPMDQNEGSRTSTEETGRKLRDRPIREPTEAPEKKKRKRGTKKPNVPKRMTPSTVHHNYFEEINAGSEAMLEEIIDLTMEMVRSP